MDEIDDEMDDYDDYEMDQGSEGDMEGKKTL
jgi:E3 ubiquitin-protein ligase HUWE1